jgi:predicted negative regulator of RcsB-dependent stress response
MRRTTFLALAVAILPTMTLAAESFRRGGVEFNAMRTVSVPAGAKAAPIVVVQFFHHGEIAADKPNVIVCTRKDQLVPTKILQLGPGDLCRVAFLAIPGQDQYEILYGGTPPDKPIAPPWNSKDGLLLETRHYKDCNLNNLDSVRKAFESAKPYGADYVENVHHSSNPFAHGAEPFLSRYTGNLHITSAATYGFLTASQDCSFLLVDGKLVIAAPGRHGPAHNAQRGSRQDVQLKPGVYPFEYYHASAGPNAIMVAAWEVNPPEDKPKPVAIPTDVFRSKTVTRVNQTGPVTLRDAKSAVPDFLMAIAGDVPLPDNPQPLVGVAFKDVTPKSLSTAAKVHWDFGDGQTSDRPDPLHVYLKPGVYAVKLSYRRAPNKPVETVNRVEVGPLTLTAKEKEKFHTLDMYLPILQTYDAAKLDAGGLRQLVAAYEAKIQEVEAKPETAAEAGKYVAAAVEGAKAAFLDESAAGGGSDEDLLKLAHLIGPMARDRLADSLLAFQIWKGAARRIKVGDLRAEAAAEAADIAVNDLLMRPDPAGKQPDVAKKMLEATNSFLTNRRGPSAGQVQRVWGDYYASVGDGKAARKAYQEAEQLLGTSRRYIERTAWRGAHARSTEEFIMRGRLDRAAGEIHAWQREFPTEKLDGYITLMYARYWDARKKYAQAVAQVEQLLCANPDSPYIDQALKFSADCDVKRGQTAGALATLNRLVKNYPGSPLVPDVKKQIARLQSGEPEPKKPTRGKKTEEN